MAPDVDHDAVALGDEGDGTTVDGLGGDVADTEAVGSPGEAAVGDERSVAATAGALHGPGDGEHLAHAGTALGTLVSDDDDVTGLDPVVQHGDHGGILAVEHAGPAVEVVDVEAGHLHDGAQRGERAGEHGNAADVVDGIVEGVDDLAVGGGRIEQCQVLGDGPAGDGDLVAVQEALVEEHLQHDRHATDAVDVDHVVVAVGLGVGEVRHLGGDPVEVVEFERHVGLEGDRQQVQHGVGGAPQRHDDGDGVLECGHGHDLAWSDVLSEQLHHSGTAGVGAVSTAAVDGRGRG